MTATVTVTDNIVKADDIILKLDALATAYEEVLSMAKQQLEQFTISEEDWARIYERLSRRIDYYDLGSHVRRSLWRGLQRLEADPDATDDEDIMFAKTLMSRIRYELEAAIKSHLISDELKDEVAAIRSEFRDELRAIAENAAECKLQSLATDQVRTADQQNRLTRELLTSCFGGDLKSMVRDAIRESAS
jgi:hypothetical protein